MRTSSIWLGAALMLAGPLACEPAAPPVVPTPGAATAPTTTTVAVVARGSDQPSFDLSPVAEPADLVGLVRWKNPGISFANLSGCAGLPQELSDQGSKALLGQLFKDALRGLVDAKLMASAIAVEAPMDVVVALDQSSRKPKPYWAFSMGLSSLDGAKAAITQDAVLVEVTPGVWRIGDKEKQRDSRCVIAASAGSTPARLVCSDHEKDVLALAPYLTRTMPTTAPAASDLHGEFRITPIEGRYGQELRQVLKGLPVLAQSQASIGDATFDDALLEAATALSGEVGALVSDLDKISVDIGADRNNCLSTTGSIQLRGKSSWLANTMADRADRAGAPPALYWKLPKDADSAFFGRAGDPSRYTDILRVLRKMIEGGLGKLKIGSADDRKALVELLDIRLSKDTNTVSASGRGDAQKPARAAKPGASKAQQVVEAMINSSVGWYVMGFDDSPEAVLKSLKSLVSVYNRKGLIDPIKKELRDDARFFPTVKMGAGPAALGKGAQDVEIKFEFVAEPPSYDSKGKKVAPKGDKVSFTFHILLVQDGKTSWLGIGANKDELVKRLQIAKGGAEADTLASRAGIESLRSGKNMTGGFMTLNVMTKAINSAMNGPLGQEKPAVASEILSALNGLPHKGESPMFLTTQVSAGSAPRADLTLQIGKGTVEDIGSMILAGIRIANNAKKQP